MRADPGDVDPPGAGSVTPPGGSDAGGAVAPTGRGRCSCDSGDAVLDDLCVGNETEGGCRTVNRKIEIGCPAFRTHVACSCNIEGDMEFASLTSLYCSSDMTSACLCTLNINVTGNVTLFPGTSIAVSTLRLFATGDVKMMSGSVINATGLGLNYRSSERVGMLGYGGSNGGRGGQSSCSSGKDILSPVIGFPTAPWFGWVGTEEDGNEAGFGYGGSSVGLTNYFGGRGGGRVLINSGKRLAIGGIIVADGARPPDSCPADCGSGAGGTIVLNATDLVGDGSIDDSSTGSQSAVSAVGGDTYRNNTGAGGGGRVALLGKSSINMLGAFDIRTYGGLHISQNTTVDTDPTNCLGGAAGTILRGVYSSAVDSYIGSVQISNCPTLGQCDASDFAYSSTPFEYPPPEKVREFLKPKVQLVSLQINKYASINSTNVTLDQGEIMGINTTTRVDSGIFINAGRFYTAYRISAATLQLTSGSTIRSWDGSIFVIPGGLNLDYSSGFSFGGSLVIEVQQNATIAGSIRANDQTMYRNSQLTSYLQIFAKHFILVKGGSIVSDRVSIISDGKVDIYSRVSATYIPACAQVSSRRVCKDFRKDVASILQEESQSRQRTGVSRHEKILSNYSLVILVLDVNASSSSQNIIEQDLVLHDTAEVGGRSMLICSNYMAVRGSIKGTGQGCLGDSGPGVGCSSPQSAGGGGGHGGLGGTGIGCDTHGQTYDSEEFPILSGSGGGHGQGGTGGGNGGGVIMIGATSALQLEGHIQSDGSNGDGQGAKRDAAGGGGSGGAVHIASPTICSPYPSPGIISANGGDGGAGGGGGGGGGRIAISFADENTFLESSIAQDKYFIPIIDNSDTRLIACTHFGNYSSKVDTSGGHSGKTDLYERDPRGPTKYDGTNGTIKSPNCQRGHGGTWCELCPFGYYKSEIGPMPCEECMHRDCIKKGTCTWLPEISEKPVCPVVCNPGYVLPNCVTPLENLIESMGGIVVFASVIAGLGLLVAIVFTCVCTRVEWCPGYYANEAKMRRKRLRTMQSLFNHRRQLGFGMQSEGEEEDDYGTPLLSARSGNEAYFVQNNTTPTFDTDASDGYHELAQIEKPFRLGRASSENGDEVLRSPGHTPPRRRRRRAKTYLSNQTHRKQERLTEADIAYHVGRVYFAGKNSTRDPWMMPDVLPNRIVEMCRVDPEKYALLCQAVNKLAVHSRITSFISFALHIVCYPLGRMYMKRQREIRAHKVREFFETYDHACVESARARALMNTFKFGTDKDCTMSYVDILSTKPIAAVSRPQRLPMLIFLSGDGSYWSPFFVDTNDVLVRAVPQLVRLRTFIDQTWADLITQLNTAMRHLDPYYLDGSAQGALKILEKYSSVSAGDKLGGLHVQLGLFPTPVGENVDEHLHQSPVMNVRRLALLLTRDEEEEPDLGEGSGLIPAPLTINSPLPDSPLDGSNGSENSTEKNTENNGIQGSVINEHLSVDEKRLGAAAVLAFEEEERMRELDASKQQVIEQQVGTETADTSDVVKIVNRRASAPMLVSPQSALGFTIRDQALLGAKPTLAESSGTFTASLHNIPIPPIAGIIPDNVHDTLNAAVENLNGQILRRLHSEESEDDYGFAEYSEGYQLDILAKIQIVLRHSFGVLLNRSPRRRDSQWFSRVALSALIAGDITCTFFILTTFFCVNHPGHRCIRTLFILVLAIYPLALVIGPILGITFVVFPLSGLGRHYSIWNALSVLNAIVACMLTVVFQKNFSWETGLSCMILLLVKILQARSVDWYIALIETDRGRRNT